MLAYSLVDRPTRHLDLFTPRSEDVHRLADAFATASAAAAAPQR